MSIYQKITPSVPERAPVRDVKIQREQAPATYGVERLTREQALTVSHAFGQDMRAGLEKRPSSLKMYPTYLEPVDKEKLQVGMQSLVLEVGGTHIRSSIVGLDNEKNPQLLNEFLLPESKRKYSTTDEFFDEVAKAAQPVLQNQKVRALGIIWSFPADIAKTQNGIDAYQRKPLTKELVIPGIDGGQVGDFVVAALKRSGIDVPADFPRAVANDTAAVLLANGATLGGIVATGYNFAFLHDGQMYNMEAGGFSGVPQTTLTQAILSFSDVPNEYFAEKQTSGRYVGEAFNMVLHEMGITDREYTSADMSEVLTGKLFADNPLVKEVAETLRDRSAQVAGAAIAGAIREFPEDFPDTEVVILIDGSFFGKTPGYQEAVEFYAANLLDDTKKIVTKYVKESGMKGAGIAALSLVK